MRNSKNIMILVIFSLILVFGLQTISAASLDTGYDCSVNDNTIRSDDDYDEIMMHESNMDKLNDKNSSTSEDVNIQTTTHHISGGCDPDEKITSDEYLDERSDSKVINKKQANIKKVPREKEAISIHVDDVTCNVNENAFINVQFNSSDVTEGVLIFYVDDDVVATHNLSHADNTLLFDTYGYEVGVHDIYVEYTASLIYESTDTHANLIINRHPTYIDNFSSQFSQDNDINITFDLLSDGEYVQDASIGLYYNDQLIKTVALNETTANIILPSSYNQQIIRITYDGDDYYESLDDYQLINIEKRHLTIYTPSITAYHASQSDVTITINNDTRLVDGVIELYVDDLLVYAGNVTSDKPVISLNLTNYLEGTYPLIIRYTDSDVFDDASYTTTLKVNRIKTVIYSNNITAYRNNPVTLRASVYNYVDDTDEGLVEFFLDDETIQTSQITNNTVSYEYVIPDTLDYGEHNLKIIYYGSDKYQQSETNTILTLKKYKTTLYIKNTTIDDNGLINVNLNLYSYNQTVDDGIVNFYVNGQLVDTADVTDNQAKIVLPPEYLPNVAYDISIVYTNSDYFNDSTLNGSMQHNRTNTTTGISKYLSNNNTLNITAYVYAKDYSNINEGSIKVYLNGSLIDTCNVTNNTATTTYDMTGYPSGNYTLSIEYSGSKRYDSSSNTTNIEKIITPKTIYINTLSSIKSTPDSTVTVKANLTDYESNLIRDIINATIKYDNQTINATFENGLLEVNITSPESTGKYTIEIVTNNSTEYKQAKRNITLNVNRNNTYISSPNVISSLKLEEVQLNLTLNDNNGPVQTKTPVQIMMDNNIIYQGFFQNGLLQYKFKLNTSHTQSQYNITVIAGQTKTYSSSTKDITLKLQNRKTYIKSENIYSKKGNQIIFNAELYDSITHKRVNKTVPVVIKLNDLTILTTNTTNGKIIATYPNGYNNTNYSITIKSATTGIYESSQWNGTLINTRDPVKVSAGNIYANANSTITIRATIYKDNKPATDRIPVAIKINNLTIATMNVTDSKIEYQYKLPDNLSQKEYNITIVTADTQNVIQSTTNFKLFVTKNYQQINTNNITAHRNDMINVKANLTDKNGNIIRANHLVNIKIAGITIANVNAVDGIINYNYTLPNLKAGYYDMILKTGQTNCYLHATCQSVLKIVD